MEANVKQPDLAEQIPGQRSQAPASTGSMPGEVERNIGNTMGAMPGASAAKGFQGGARGLMALLGNLPNMLRGSSGQGGEAPMGEADQNLGAAIMAQAKEKPQAAAPVAAPISRPTSQMTPQQMERAMVNTAPPAGVASLPSVAPQRAPAPVRPPVAAAPPPAKSAAQLYQEKLLSGKGLADPTAAVLSAAMLLDYLGNPVAAARIERAVAIDLASRGDSKRSTAEIAQSIFAQL
jgi:hypothetical protein